MDTENKPSSSLDPEPKNIYLQRTDPAGLNVKELGFLLRVNTHIGQFRQELDRSVQHFQSLFRQP